jgi:hypothetical protein
MLQAADGQCAAASRGEQDGRLGAGHEDLRPLGAAVVNHDASRIR